LEKRHNRRALTEAELGQLLAAALAGPARRAAKAYKGAPIPLERQAELAEQGRRNALIYRLLVLTGLRVNEGRLLTWADLDLDAATLTTRPEWQGNKSGRTETLPLAPALVELLRDWRARHPAEAAAPVVRLPQCFLRTLDSDLEAAGIDKRNAAGRVVDLHALRHTHGSRLVASGADIKTVQALMRHATPALTLGVYVHRDKGRMAAAVAGLPDVKPAPRPGPDREAAAALRTGTDNRPLDAETNPKVVEVGARLVQDGAGRNAQGKAVAVVSNPRPQAFQASDWGSNPHRDAIQNNAAQDCNQARKQEVTSTAPLQSENCEHCAKLPNEPQNCKSLVQGLCKSVAQAPAPVLPADLEELARLWPSLPEAVKQSWIVSARTLAGKGQA
jgi:hypothetical protein